MHQPTRKEHVRRRGTTDLPFQYYFQAITRHPWDVKAIGKHCLFRIISEGTVPRTPDRLARDAMRAKYSFCKHSSSVPPFQICGFMPNGCCHILDDLDY